MIYIFTFFEDSTRNLLNFGNFYFSLLLLSTRNVKNLNKYVLKGRLQNVCFNSDLHSYNDKP